MNRNGIFKYKGVSVNSFGIPINPIRKKKNNEHKKKSPYHCSFFSPFKKSSPKNLIVMYDIPDENKKERDWFRRHLKKFDYIMIQRSIWVGPSPLPKDFLNYVKSIKLENRLKVFKLEKPYSTSSNNLEN